MLYWREIGNINLTQAWQETELTNSSLFRITHQIDNQPPDTLRAVIGQSAEGIVFDRRLMGYKLGAVEGQLIPLPEGVIDRRLAVQRLDKVTGTNWTIKIEELVEMAVTFPLPISEVDGLQAALDSKLDNDDLVNIQGQLDAKADTSEVITALAGKANTSDVTAALAGKAPTVHNHIIGDVTGLQTALDEKAIASDVTTALAGKAPTIHNHVPADITGLTAFVQSLQVASQVTSTTAPTPFPGLVWNEIDGSNRLIKSWRYINNRWQSQTEYSLDYPSGGGNITAGFSSNYALDDRYDYLFKDAFVCGTFTGPSTITATDYWKVDLNLPVLGSSIFDSGALPNTGISKLFAINSILIPGTGERIALTVSKIGNPSAAKIATTLRYHQLRK